MKNRIGFTLIELLVVIAIIAILAAILFPVFAKVREKARQTTCLSNEKQLGLAVAQYTQDFDEQYPCGFLVNNTQYNGLAGWAGEIYPYVKSDAAYACPDDNSPATPNVSYAMNVNLAFGENACWQIGATSTPIKLSQLQSPASTVELFEVTSTTTDDPSSAKNTTASYDWSQFADGGGDGAYCASYEFGYTGTTQYATGLFPQTVGPASYPGGNQSFLSATGRHTDGSNYLMADSHAKWLRASAVSAGENNATAGNEGTPVNAPATSPTAASTSYSGPSGGNVNPAFAATFSFD